MFPRMGEIEDERGFGTLQSRDLFGVQTDSGMPKVIRIWRRIVCGCIALESCRKSREGVLNVNVFDLPEHRILTAQQHPKLGIGFLDWLGQIVNGERKCDSLGAEVTRRDRFAKIRLSGARTGQHQKK